MDRLLTIEELAEYLGVQIQTIYKWTHQGCIPFTKVGKLLRFREGDIARWLEKHTSQGKDTKVASENIWRELQSVKFRPPKRQRVVPVRDQDQDKGNVSLLTASTK